jgi:outer membrane protein OmpA-like peptidoglycan-associated protein
MSNKFYVLVSLFIAMMQLAGCATQSPDRVTLLPQPDGTPSAIAVTSKTGDAAVIDRPYQVALVSDKKIGLEQTDEAAVRLRYKELLEALPARPKSYQLYFENNGTRLTSASEKLLQVVQDTLKDFPAPEIIIIGHTDTVGADALNDKLSLQRAVSIENILKTKGIDTSRISTVGRGSRDLLVPTGKGVSEEKNRRVEIRLK